MHQIRLAAVVLFAALISGCVTTATTVTKSPDQPVPVVGLNVLYVNAALTTTQGDNKGSTRPTVTFDVNQLEGAITREIPPKFFGVRRTAEGPDVEDLEAKANQQTFWAAVTGTSWSPKAEAICVGDSCWAANSRIWAFRRARPVRAAE